MKVVSVDPAPAKDAVIFDGEFDRVSAPRLPAYCARLATDGDTLLCWDAPLTGPPSVDHENTYCAAYSQRVIERFFSRAVTKFKAPAGIAVLPYSGCSHWAITRASVGLPRVGSFDKSLDALPFHPIDNTSFDRQNGNWIVEIHPAVAIWLWCRDTENDPNGLSWVYKGRRAADIPTVTNVVTNMDVPNDDDQLDAVVGWVLGTMLVQNHPSVTIVGTLSTGAIALPCNDFLLRKFSEFCQSTAI